MTVSHLKALGILGDSLTFLGSVSLAVEALSRRSTVTVRRDRLAAAGHLRDGGFNPIDSDSRPVDEISIEDSEVRFGTTWSQTGLFLLIAGFGVLLAVRILGE